MMSDTEKLKVLEEILMDLQGMESCYPEPDVADAIVAKYQEVTGDKTFASDQS